MAFYFQIQKIVPFIWDIYFILSGRQKEPEYPSYVIYFLNNFKLK